MTYALALAQAFLSALMTRPAGPLLTTPKVHLYTSASPPPSPTSAVADFTEATFTGYSAVVISALSGPVNLPDGSGYGMIANAVFTAGAIVTGQTALGYWIDDGTSTFYGAEAFQTPVPFAHAGDFCDIQIIFPMTNPMSA